MPAEAAVEQTNFWVVRMQLNLPGVDPSQVLA